MIKQKNQIFEETERDKTHTSLLFLEVSSIFGGVL